MRSTVFFNFAIKCSGGERMKCLLNNIKNLTQSRTSYGYATPAGIPMFGKALYFKDVSTCLITDNEIKYWIYGVQYYENSTSKQGYFYENSIRNCKYGLVIANVQDPINYTGSNNTSVYGNQIDLHTQCNLFTGNEFGIVGTGKLTDQGSSTLSAGNRFHNLSLGGYLNSINSIIWYYTNPPAFEYFYYSLGSNIDAKPDLVNNGNIFLDIATPSQNGANGSFTITPAAINNCTDLLNGPIMSTNTLESYENIVLYPNPANTSIYIEGILPGSEIKLHSVNGQLICSTNIENGAATFDISMLQIGVYVIQITNSTSTIAFKFIKAE